MSEEVLQQRLSRYLLPHVAKSRSFTSGFQEFLTIFFLDIRSSHNTFPS